MPRLSAKRRYLERKFILVVLALERIHFKTPAPAKKCRRRTLKSIVLEHFTFENIHTGKMLLSCEAKRTKAREIAQASFLALKRQSHA